MSGTPLSPEPSELVPFNTYRPNRPAQARVLSNERISAADADEVRHVVLDLDGLNFSYREGQSIGVITPGIDDRGHANKLRLYSIASSRHGDDGQDRTASLCVKRVLRRDDQGRILPGVGSNYLCDTKPGDLVAITGPVGKTFLLPSDPTSHLILAATGTGIAPFRGFLREIFGHRTDWTGQVWLFLGAKSEGECLYRAEFESYRKHPNFHLDVALSRRHTGYDGERMYVHHKMHDHIDSLWKLLDQENSLLYICGKRGMETHIDREFDLRAQADNVPWSNFRHLLLDSGRLLVETY